MDNIFLQKKKEVKKQQLICDRPTDHNNGHPLDWKQKFFLGWPYRPSIPIIEIMSQAKREGCSGFQYWVL